MIQIQQDIAFGNFGCARALVGDAVVIDGVSVKYKSARIVPDICEHIKAQFSMCPNWP
jgi:hypothetical protein